MAGQAQPARAKALDLPADGDVMDVCAIPRQQDVHSMHRGHCDVRSIHCGIGGNQPRAENLDGEFAGVFGRRQAGQTLKRRRAGHRHLRISAPRFEIHEFGKEQFIIAPPLIPPLPRCGLLAAQDRVPAAPRHQITWDGGFEVEPGFHAWSGNGRSAMSMTVLVEGWNAPLPLLPLFTCRARSGFGRCGFSRNSLIEPAQPLFHKPPFRQSESKKRIFKSRFDDLTLFHRCG